MTDIHFFGCSYTVGDELIDDQMFPWKHECKDATEYFLRRTVPSGYQERNKRLAYPALLQSPEMRTFNHAKNGASIQENVINLVELVSKNTKIDYIYFQISPSGRELVVDSKDCVTSLHSAVNPPGFEKYLDAKRVSHKLWQYSLEDFTDLIMLHGYLTNKGIKHKFVELDKQINEFRVNDLKNTKFRFLINEYYRLPILDISAQLKPFPKLLGNHFSKEAHVEMARLISLDLKEINS
jgi:hypothetical protein